MPKVSSEYFDNKRKMIVEAAYQVCLRKPAEVVTISDVSFSDPITSVKEDFTESKLGPNIPSKPDPQATTVPSDFNAAKA